MSLAHACTCQPLLRSALESSCDWSETPSVPNNLKCTSSVARALCCIRPSESSSSSAESPEVRSGKHHARTRQSPRRAHEGSHFPARGKARIVPAPAPHAGYRPVTGSGPRKRTSYEPVEQSQQQKRGWPLANEGAPVAFAREPECCGCGNGRHRRPVPGGLRDAVGETEILVLCGFHR